MYIVHQKLCKCIHYAVVNTVVLDNTVVHDFNGHGVTGIHGPNGKKYYDKDSDLLNNRHDLKGKFPYDDFFRKTHARLYI